MAVVVDSLKCIAGYVCAQCSPWEGLEHVYMHGSVVHKMTVAEPLIEEDSPPHREAGT